MQNAASPGESRRIYQEMINNYILGNLSVYQKAIRKQKLNSRQRTDRFSGESLTRHVSIPFCNSSSRLHAGIVGC